MITLHYSARPVRRSGNAEKLTSICSDLNAVKEKVIVNLQENNVNQSQTDSIVQFASAFEVE